MGDDKQSDMSARVYKISRDDRGERLTHIKVTGGSLKLNSLLMVRRLTRSEYIQVRSTLR